MEAVLEQDALAKAKPPRMSEEEFDAWCDENVKAEWIDGEVIVHSPATLKHVLINGWLLKIIGLFVDKYELGIVVGPEMQVRIPGRRRVPDLAFVARERQAIVQRVYVDGPPDLVVEIVSADSVARDWRDKYLEYEAAGVREYWVIDPNTEQMHIYCLDERGQYQLLDSTEGALHSRVLPGFWLRPEWLWPESLPNPIEILQQLKVI